MVPLGFCVESKACAVGMRFFGLFVGAEGVCAASTGFSRVEYLVGGLVFWGLWR